MINRFSLALLLLATACGANVKVGEYSLDQELWDSAQAQVRERAAFELKCPKEQLALTLLAAQFPADTRLNAPKQIGVDGCGRRLVYVVSRSGWVLNSSDAAPSK